VLQCSGAAALQCGTLLHCSTVALEVVRVPRLDLGLLLGRARTILY